ncbi:MAG TPA: hypothetical protein VMW24_24090 [Sedimentisphaerales bacterium]|nr:hypothetical protein [Sedimentisphaerales bacterium]
MSTNRYTFAKQQILDGPDGPAKDFLLAQLRRKESPETKFAAPPKPLKQQLRDLDEKPVPSELVERLKQVPPAPPGAGEFDPDTDEELQGDLPK